MLNSLAQTRSLTVPGVPDLIKAPNCGTSAWWIPTIAGRSIWRAPAVDGRAGDIDAAAIAGLLDRWKDGAVKLALISRPRLRRTHSDLFAEGTYEALEVVGAREIISVPLRAARQERVVAAALVAALDAEPAGATPSSAAARVRATLAQTF